MIGRVWQNGERGSPDRSRRRARSWRSCARHLSAPASRHGHAVALRETKHGRARARQRPDERAFYAERFRRLQIDRRAIRLRALQRDHLFRSERKETARSRSANRARHSAHPASVRTARRSTASKSPASTFRRARSAAIISITSKWTTTGSASPLPMFRAKACRPRSSWRFAAASCAARRRGNPSPADVLQKVNRQLYPDIKEDMFISMAYVILDHARNT